MDEFQIISGPSKGALQRALFDRRRGRPREVIFETDSRVNLIATIAMVAPEDGSGDSWIIEGKVVDAKVGRVRSGLTFKFRGWYSSHRRAGRITEVAAHTLSVTT